MSKTLNLTDGRTVSYAALHDEVGPRFAASATLEVFRRQAAAAQRALDRLATELVAAAPDVVVVIGDDEEELFGPENQPAVSMYMADHVVMHARPRSAGNPLLDLVAEGCAMERVRSLAGHAAVAQALARSLSRRGIDIATAGAPIAPDVSGVGHAFGFVARRLLGLRPIPIIPFVLNTYYPPNVPGAGRCLEIGRQLAAAIAELREVERVAVVASGGLSHFVTDEALDKRILAALAAGQAQVLADLPRQALRSGSSELLTWILGGAALADLRLAWAEYEPVYRTPAGTGIGLAFAGWCGPGLVQ